MRRETITFAFYILYLPHSPRSEQHLRFRLRKMPEAKAAMRPHSVELSSRCKVFMRPALPYLERALEAVFDEYSESNPHGRIPLAIAENKLNADSLLVRMSSFPGYTKDVLNYTDTTGLPTTKLAVAKFLGAHIFHSDTILPSNLVISSGCTALLNELSILLFEKGDSVLTPAPYYAAFDADFLNIGGVTTVPIWPKSAPPPYTLDQTACDWMQDNMTVEAFDDAFQRAVTAGHRPKALLIVNPSNPTGVVHTKEQLLTALIWARSNGLHLIVDEIYALSVYDSPVPFKSIASILNNQLGDDVHVLWGLSKDFGASGLRVGVIYSQNQQLLKALSNINMAIQVSNLVQEMTVHILQDETFVMDYFSKMRHLLKNSFDIMHPRLIALGIKIISPCGAGLFCFADFRSFLSEQTFLGERILFNKMADMGVVLTPGESCHCAIPGFFRICFAWVPVSSLLEAIRRIEVMATSLSESKSELKDN